MDARVLRWLLSFAVVSTAIHFTHNFVEIEEYPQSDLVSDGPVKAAIVISWPLFTALAVHAYRLYARGDHGPARRWLAAYGLWAMVSLGHFVNGNPDIPLVWYATIWTDVLAGALVLAFALLARDEPATVRG
ncbi:MAG TPA: hypothetical protein VGW75_01090 [Solirubrobacteraceae bacterium]|jgi:hypothetical protein|nr:hypothetical protein [Solirubrobacteraceae bacterium]